MPNAEEPRQSAQGDRACFRVDDGLVIDVRPPGGAWETKWSDLPEGFVVPAPRGARRVAVVSIGDDEATVTVAGMSLAGGGKLSPLEGEVLGAILACGGEILGANALAQEALGDAALHAKARATFSDLAKKLERAAGQPVVVTETRGRRSAYKLAPGFQP